METNAIIGLVAAAMTVLGALGAGVKWLVSTIIASQEKSTKAFTESSEKLGVVINESTAATVSAINSLRLEHRESRVEIRTLIGMQPPKDEDTSEDGEPAPLTPLRGVPVTSYQQVNRKGKP